MTIFGAEQPTSYFSEPSQELDPKLFQGRSLQSWVRNGITSLLNDFLSKKFRHPELWAHPWLAGSAVSYQWSADREPADLDCLVGINVIQFRQANPSYRGFTDKEISDELNDDFTEDLHPTTENWNGFELTFYALTTDDITNIRPYAAYDLKYNEWTVTPNPTQQAHTNPQWDDIVHSDYQLAQQIHTRFTASKDALSMAYAGPQRRNEEVKLYAAGQQADALYQEIHGNRGEAFSITGQGYGDFHNYRWQSGKRSGTIDLLRQIRHHIQSSTMQSQQELYGTELPDTSTLVRRAATYRNK
jgi:hypothetical protein